jgi:ferredoxin-NADP reductase
MAITLHQFKLLSTKMLTPSVKQFVIRNTQQPSFDFIPGQFITIHFEHSGKMLKRSYSIANSPTTDHSIEFAASHVESGPGTEYLFNLKPEDTLQVSGPFGRLILKEDTPKRYIFVATSTGITPYRSMIPLLQQRLEANPDLSIVVLEGVQKQQDLLYADDFISWAEQTPRMIFRGFLSREQPNEPHLHHGYVQHGFADLQLNPAEDHVYLCGNPAMIDDAFQWLQNQGFSSQQIIREKYISSK